MAPPVSEAPPAPNSGGAIKGQSWRLRLPQNWGRGGLSLLLLLSLVCPAHSRPQVLVVITDHLTLADVMRSDLPNLARMEREGQTALMSPGLAQGTDPVANVYATLGAGDSVRVGDVSQGRMTTALRQAGRRTALIGNADGDDTGPYQPARLFLPTPDVTPAADGAVSDPTAPGGKRITPRRLWRATRTALRDCDLVVVHFGDFARAERENQRGDLLPTAYQGHRRRALLALDRYLGMAYLGFRSDTANPGWLFLVVPEPPLTARGTWDRLTPYLQVPPSAGSQGYVCAHSETTQTAGLVAARDFAPTVLTALGVPIPLQMTGAAIKQAPLNGDQGLSARLRRLDRLTHLNQQAQNPLFWSLGLLGAAILFTSLGLYLSGRMTQGGTARNLSRYSLRLLSAWPLALLLAPLFPATTVGVYLAGITVLTALLALLPTPTMILSLTALVLVGDGLSGTQLVSQSVLSAYALSGIRFYGIGNEYMGVLLGGALLVAGLASPPSLRLSHPPAPSLEERGSRKRAGGPTTFLSPLWRRGAGGEVIFLWFALVTLVLSFPAFGAKAGGAVTAVATFVVAWRRLCGRPVTWAHLAASLLAGFGLVFVWAVVGHWLPIRRTHIDTAVEALWQGRLGYIAGVAWRKVGLAVRVFLHPGTLLGLVGLILVGGVLRRLLRRQVRGYLKRHSRFAAVWAAGLWGCLVALLFNDSGIVAAVLLLSCLLLALLHGLYRETCES